MWMILSAHLQELKSKGKVHLGNLKIGHGYLMAVSQEPFIAKLKSQFKGGFTNVVVTRASFLREWFQG